LDILKFSNGKIAVGNEMTESTVVYCDLTDSQETGTALGNQIRAEFKDAIADVVIVFASSNYNFTKLLEALKVSSKSKIIVGCSSAGEFITGKHGVSAASALAMCSSDMKFTLNIGRGIRANRSGAARELISTFQGKNTTYPYRSVLLLADALAGYTDSLIEELTTLTGGTYQFFGGGSGDDAKFSQTHVFHDTKAETDAVVGLEILSVKPLGVGAEHGWDVASEPFKVTESEGMRLISLNSIPAVEVFEEHSEVTKQEFDKSNPMSFFLHNTLGIKAEGGYKIRVPLSVQADGSVLCASDIPTGATVYIMKASNKSSEDAAQTAVESALKQLGNNKPKTALFFDCVATRLRMGKDFGLELQALQNSLGQNTKYAGCNSYGQIARVEGQFSGFHNCTAVVCIFPE